MDWTVLSSITTALAQAGLKLPLAGCASLYFSLAFGGESRTFYPGDLLKAPFEFASLILLIAGGFALVYPIWTTIRKSQRARAAARNR